MFVDIRENSNKRIILFAMSNTDHKTENSNTTYIILSIPDPIRLQTSAVISRSLAFVKKSFNGMLFRPPKVRDSKEGG